MHRVLVPSTAVSASTITLDDPHTLHHVRTVLRVKAGDRIVCLDGAGARYVGVIQECARQRILITVETRQTDSPPAFRITLAQALIRPERFEWVIQKATELGVARISPMITARSLMRHRGAHRGTRWARIAQEAAAQCGRSILPELDPPQSFESLWAHLADEPRVFMATLAPSTEPLRTAFEDVAQTSSATLLIGPEGDFTPAEVVMATQHNARLISLGPLTLRAETAAIAAIAILQFAAGQWS